MNLGHMSVFYFWRCRWLLLVFFIIPLLPLMSRGSKTNAGGGGPPTVVKLIDNHKDFKKLLRTRNNVLVYFRTSLTNPKGREEVERLFGDVSEVTRGLGTLVRVDCTLNEGKKLCKKLKVKNDLGYAIKHYQKGEYHKDYDRPLTLESMEIFIRDPTGDAPWDEDEASRDVLHLKDAKSLTAALKKDKKEKLGMMVMFYAPWCGFCKKLKPDYQRSATEVKGKGIMAALDVTRPSNVGIGRKYNVTGYPTLIYFEGGQEKFTYLGDNKQDSLVEFWRKPWPRTEEAVGGVSTPEEDIAWSQEEGSSVIAHLTDDTFDAYLDQHSSVLVMFYAPWCGHCKKMKPEFIQAAEILSDFEFTALAAVDCTRENGLAKRFRVQGFPTLKYFKNTQHKFDAPHVRTADDIVKFMKNPTEPPAPEKPWSEEESEVVHLDEETFKPFLKKKKHVLLMFYAPWCGHCKAAKPELVAAAEAFKDNPKVEFAAVDCTIQRSVCSAYKVSGFPTFIYFNYFKHNKPYMGGRMKNDFMAFMENPDGAPPLANNPWMGLHGAENVAHLKGDTFERILQDKEHSLVLFYAPWCGHCTGMMKDYSAAAQSLASMSSLSIAMAAVDATSERDLAAKFNIESFPTLKYFHFGKNPQDYEGGRSRENFVKFIRDKVDEVNMMSKQEL